MDKLIYWAGENGCSVLNSVGAEKWQADICYSRDTLHLFGFAIWVGAIFLIGSFVTGLTRKHEPRR